MLNELNTTPFEKIRCMAMLNTLYPPRLQGESMSTCEVDGDWIERDAFLVKIIGNRDGCDSGFGRSDGLEAYKAAQLEWIIVAHRVREYFKVTKIQLNES